MPFTVTQRTRETGIRSALGAQGSHLVGLVVRNCIGQLALGLPLVVGFGLIVVKPLQGFL
jgi:ABC-type antimicrobial peptide transport system permease subunit